MSDAFELLARETKRLYAAGKTEIDLPRKVYDQALKGAGSDRRISINERGRPVLNGIVINRK